MIKYKFNVCRSLYSKNKKLLFLEQYTPYNFVSILINKRCKTSPSILNQNQEEHDNAILKQTSSERNFARNRNFSAVQCLTNDASLGPSKPTQRDVEEQESENVEVETKYEFALPGSCNDYTTRTHTCGQLRASDVGKIVTVYGWLKFSRMNKFIHLRDAYGTIQVVVNVKQGDGSSIFTDLHLEDVVRVTGIVQLRPVDQVKKNLDTGDIEIEANDVQIVNKAIPNLPFHISVYNKASDQTLNKHRYLALRFPELQNNLRFRSDMLFRMREFLIQEKNFVEVETPTLFKRTPGGAQEFIVPTHAKNKFYSLVQSPQQLKQLLMVGSIDRYFQIARCYRDERTNTERQPEFTQLDIELSFTNAESVMALTEDVLAASWPRTKSPLQTPFPRMQYQYALENYGSDKPCVLDKFLIQNAAEFLPEDCTNAAYMFVIPEGQKYYNKLQSLFDALTKETEVHVYAVKVPSVKKLLQSLNKIVPGFRSLAFEKNVNLHVGDVLVLAMGTKKEKTIKILGHCRHQTIDLLKLIDERNEKGIYDFIWVVNIPLLEEDENGVLTSTHHPFTHPHPEDIPLLPLEPLKVRSLAYDLVLNGSEIGGGSIRIHSKELQKQILNQLKLPEEDFNHLLDALGMGCPPHGGIALGLDRLIAILCNRKTIKDVIAFPKGTEGQDLMTECPDDVPIADKMRYHIYLPDSSTPDTSPRD